MEQSKLMDQTVTLYHKIGENDGRGEYRRFLMRYVRLESKQGIQPVLSGNRPYNSFKLYARVPGRVENASGDYLMYVDKFEYEELDETQRSSCWTVSEGDIVTDGETLFDLSRQTLDEIKAQAEVYTVNIIIPCELRGMKFLEITGRGRVLE